MKNSRQLGDNLNKIGAFCCNENRDSVFKNSGDQNNNFLAHKNEDIMKISKQTDAFRGNINKDSMVKINGGEKRDYLAPKNVKMGVIGAETSSRLVPGGLTLSANFLRAKKPDGKLAMAGVENQAGNLKLAPIKMPMCEGPSFGMKFKNKKDPLPMKLRALPSSFWRQPNQSGSQSPAPAPALPPLAMGEVNAQREEDPPVVSSTWEQTSPSVAVVSDANTELLFSLFHGVENKRKSNGNKRGRPKKLQYRSSSGSGGPRDDDPCLCPAGLLPSLTPAAPKQPMDGAKTNGDQLNYAQLLNELVIQL